MMRYALVLLVLSVPSAFAQQFTDAIEDNSFFIEEAYNQEDGVVQHIPNVYRATAGGATLATFTQEWPVFSQTHQFSYTVPYLSATGSSGVGDVMLNYRYQLVRSADGLAVSPRVSLILPTGDESKGLGDGVTGIQLNLPVSKRWTNAVVTHYNLGVTLLPGVKNPAGGTVSLTSAFGGGSVIWLATERFNVMFEALHTISEQFSAAGGTETAGETILSPGFRYAVDIGGVQIVPGLAVPLSYTSGELHQGFFLYLSFEHFF